MFSAILSTVALLSLVVQIGLTFHAFEEGGEGSGVEEETLFFFFFTMKTRTRKRVKRTKAMARRMAVMRPTLPGREREGERRGAASEMAKVMLDSLEKRRAEEAGSTWEEMHWIIEEESEAEAL